MCGTGAVEHLDNTVSGVHSLFGEVLQMLLICCIILAK